MNSICVGNLILKRLENYPNNFINLRLVETGAKFLVDIHDDSFVTMAGAGNVILEEYQGEFGRQYANDHYGFDGGICEGEEIICVQLETPKLSRQKSY